jgi:NAD(P)-dependent dehydrogenase (short-subunit alcohol dehydrogenase family)
MTKNVVITGANRGIGLALTERYLALGENVFAICRQASPKLLELEGVNVISGVDVTNDEDLHRLKQHLSHLKIDLLVNNAGILSKESLGEVDYDRVLRQFQVNAIAPLRITELLLSNLNRGGKIAFISSRMGSISDNSSGGSYGYRMSKAALNAAGVSLAMDLKARDIAVGLFHPGFVRTELVDHNGNISAEEAASLISQRIDELTMDNTGTFWHSNGEILTF